MDKKQPSHVDFNPNALEHILDETYTRNQAYRLSLTERFNELQTMASEFPRGTFQNHSFAKSESLKKKRTFVVKKRQPQSPVWMDEDQLAEFANGSMAACFGEEYQIYEGRRHPRIPRAELMLMSRIDKLHAIRHHLKTPAEIFGSYDVPQQSWFTSQKYARELALSAFMEMALQPCGVLSAQLGTALTHPEIDFYFRNLDGEMIFSPFGDLRGETIQSWVKMTSTIVGADTILQRFDFSLSHLGNVFLSGNTVFGYFHPLAMAAQNGMETTDKDPFDLSSAQKLPVAWIKERHGDQRILMLDEAYSIKSDNDASNQILIGIYPIHAEDWFFKAHFLHDPVMPGSLGVEAIVQLLQSYAVQRFAGGNSERITFLPVFGEKISWKYRGQILPTDKQMRVKLTVRSQSIDNSQNHPVRLICDAEVWKDKTKLYEVKNINQQAFIA